GGKGEGDRDEGALRAQRGQDEIAGEDRSGDGAERVRGREAANPRRDVGPRRDALEQEGKGRAHPERRQDQDPEGGERADELAPRPGGDMLAREHEDARELPPERERDRDRERGNREAAGERGRSMATREGGRARGGGGEADEEDREHQAKRV